MRSTSPGNPVVVAPGKVFLIGEYAVLEGGTAVVAAVNRHAVGQFVPDLEPPSRVLAEAARVTTAALGEKGSALPAGGVLVDSTQFSHNDQKLGLGSSAAAAVVAVGALLEMAGMPVARHRDLIFSLAETAHRAAQGDLGSGADVAASVHGGVLHYFRPSGGTPVIERLHTQSALELVIFSTRTPSSTVDHIRGVSAFAERATPRYQAIVALLRAEADRFLEAYTAGNVLGTIAATRAFGKGLVELGNAAEIPIVTAPFQRAAAIASDLGGAAKPSGAGGGDVGVAFFSERKAARSFAMRGQTEGLKVLDVAIDQNGVHRRAAGI